MTPRHTNVFLVLFLTSSFDEGNVIRKLALLTLTAFTLGCAEDGGLGVEGSPIWFSRTSAAEQAAYFGRICAGYGFRQGTPEMAQCIANESRAARADGAERMRAAQAMNAMNRPVNTSCTSGLGGNFNCTTYRDFDIDPIGQGLRTVAVSV